MTMKSLDSFSRVSLGVFPTPIQRLHNLSRLMKTNVYVKRDDLTGLGLDEGTYVLRFISFRDGWLGQGDASIEVTVSSQP